MRPWKVGDIVRFDTKDTYGFAREMTGIGELDQVRPHSGWYVRVISHDNPANEEFKRVIIAFDEGAEIKPVTKLEQALK